jgi:CheY-like chemotaxis protein
MPTAAAPIHILLVEDNPADVRLTVEALKESKTPNNLRVARDGEEAIQYLRHDGVEPAIRPDVILLDLNLPRKHGREVLEEIKRDKALRYIPIVVLTTSQAEQDVLSCYDLGANAFVTKPADVDQFFRVVRLFEEFWLDTAKLLRP